MKKNILKALSFMAVSFAMVAFNACDPVVPPVDEIPDTPEDSLTAPKTPVLEVKVASVSETSAELSLTAKNVIEVAYILSAEKMESALPAVIFATGTKVDTTQTKIVLNDLDANTAYWAYFAANVDNTSYSDIVEVEFTTINYEFNKMLTLVDTEYMGYKVRITVPDEVRNEPKKYGIRYNFGSVLDVFVTKYEMGRTWATSLMENGHGCMGWQETQKDTTVYINPWNQNRQNPDGSYYIDPELGEEIMLHSPLAPGEPYLFIAGQYRYGHLDETGWGWSYGQESKDWGYYIPMWDEKGWHADYGDAPSRSNLVFDPATGLVETGEEKYWNDNSFGKNGALQVLYFKTKESAELETNFEVIVDNVTPIDAFVNFIPDENVYCYSYMICNDATYRELVETVLMGNEDWLEWFVCSYYAMRNLYVPTVSGQTAVQARDHVGAALSAGNLYHVLVTVTGDENGSKQKFIHKTFETTEKVLDAPVINVTAVDDNKNEYFATFNVKAPNKDVIRAYYAADYKREFLLEANNGSQYESLAQNAFTSEDIMQINSDEGLNVQIPSTDGQTIRMIVLGYNEEETKNELYSPEKTGRPCSAVADCNTKLLDLVPRVNSPLFDILEGEWTATAQMLVSEYDDNNNLQQYKKKFSTNISIMNEYKLPELTDEVYAIYEAFGMSKDACDAYYADLQKQVEQFNKYRLTYRNRLLCLGWFDYDYVMPSRLSLMDPFDLFSDETYSCIDNAQIMYDFGPKWYLEVDDKGNVTLPFDQWQTPPMVNWQSTVFFMSAYSQETNQGYKSAVTNSADEVIMPANFPIEIVNNDKFIIKAIQAPLSDTSLDETYPHYPNAIMGWGQADASIIRPVVSEITFTRGWQKTTTSTSSKAVRRNYVESVEMSGEDSMPVVTKSITNISEIEIPQYEVREMTVVTTEMLYESFEKRAQELFRK